MILLLPVLNILVNSITDRFRKAINYDKRKTRPIFKILHESEHFLVVNKGYDVFINTNDPSVEHSLHIELRKVVPYLVNPELHHDFYFVHRLDFATSGVLCIALHKKACILAASAFEARLTSKYYLAILRGHVANELIDIEIPIGEDAKEKTGNHQMCAVTNPNCLSARHAHTRLLVLQRGLFSNYPATKVLLKPITGRRHQLRVHCSIIGHTIVGDYTYSNRKDNDPYRTFLHSYRLVMPTDLEEFDIKTSDPFPECDDPSSWMVVERINNLDVCSFTKLDDRTLKALKMTAYKSDSTVLI